MGKPLSSPFRSNITLVRRQFDGVGQDVARLASQLCNSLVLVVILQCSRGWSRLPCLLWQGWNKRTVGDGWKTNPFKDERKRRQRRRRHNQQLRDKQRRQRIRWAAVRAKQRHLRTKRPQTAKAKIRWRAMGSDNYLHTVSHYLQPYRQLQNTTTSCHNQSDLTWEIGCLS